jgi:DnaB-like helicase N terminal domain/AAA domain
MSQAKRALADDERPLPENIDAELSVLGAILQDDHIPNHTLAKVREKIEADDFHNSLHQRIFSAMCAMSGHIDIITLSDFLNSKGRLEEAGGAAYISGLDKGIPKHLNLDHVRILKQKSQLRQLLHKTSNVQHDLEQAAHEGAEDAADILDRARLQLSDLANQQEKSSQPKIWESRNFLTQVFPPRKPLVVINSFNTPVFTARSINQLFAKRGTGKSMLAMALAGVGSTGGELLNWKVENPMRTLYVDGELPDSQIQERMRELHSQEASIKLITLDSTPGGIPSLATAQGQAWLEKYLQDIEFLIIDSLASLAPFATNDEELWIPFSSWLMRLRSRGLCILLLHQAGKLGLQRGHSRGDDPLDVQIKLEPKDDDDTDHLCCELTYEKFRGQRAGARALKIEYANGMWKWSQLEADKIKLLDEYLCLHPKASSHTIAKDLPELGSYKTVQRLIKKSK